MSPSFRVAGAGDAPAIATLINAAFRVEDFFIDGDRTHDAEVAGLMAAGRFLCAVDDADADGALLGVVYIQREGDRGYFGLLSIAPGHQRAGLGRSLVAHAEALCKAEGARHMDLKIVNLREELPAYYASLGYRESGSSAFKDTGKLRRPAHFVHMTKPL
ncbi:MAG: GNAT family N-acetyltransferase [Deltaproteobacteria bacterium]|nr:GNAT family N-acetyltransferase [Deltaproteobacteria bacterium]